jgi:hypothetical protein
VTEVAVIDPVAARVLDLAVPVLEADRVVLVVLRKCCRQVGEAEGKQQHTVLCSVGHKASQQRQHLVWLMRMDCSKCQASAVGLEQVVVPRSVLAGRRVYRMGLV